MAPIAVLMLVSDRDGGDSAYVIFDSGSRVSVVAPRVKVAS